MSLAIEVHELTKRFPPPAQLSNPMPFMNSRCAATLAVDRVTFTVHSGEIFGLLGPNGAGKTTLIKLLSTLILPSSGTARVNGFPLAQADHVRSTIGLVTSNERSFFPRLSGRENLAFYAGLCHLTRAQTRRKIASLAAMLDMNDALDTRYDRCSTGMKQRLALARALLNDASLLFLDEPTAALDPVAAAQFRERLYTLAHHTGQTILLVTHNPDEAVELCNRVAVMLQGRLYTLSDPDQLRNVLQSDRRCTLRVRDFSPMLAQALSQLETVQDLSRPAVSGDVTEVEMTLQDRRRALPEIVATVEGGGGALEGLALTTASWDAVAARLSQGDGDGATLLCDPASAPAPITCEPRSEDKGDAARHAPERWSRVRELVHAIPLFLRRDLRTQLSYRFAFVLQLAAILFSVASFYFVAQIFGAHASPYLVAYGGDYFSFVLIGIAFLGYQSVALHTFSGVIQSAQTMGTLEAMLTTPTRLSTILLASSAWSFVFTSLRVMLYLLVGAVIFDATFQNANLMTALVMLLLSITSLSGLGILSASFIMVFKRGNPINFLIDGFSTLLGGVYYPVEVLPPWLEALARIYPLTYSLQAMRRALLNGASLDALAHEALILVAFSVTLLPLSLFAFRHAVQQAKRDGSLTQF